MPLPVVYLIYEIPATQTTSRVALHFAENWSGAFANGERIFDDFVQNNMIVNDLDVYAEAGANTPLIINVPNVAPSNGVIAIRMHPEVQKCIY